MKGTVHVARDPKGLDRVLQRGVRFYHTVCGSVALLENLTLDPAESDCGICRSTKTKPPPAPEAPSPELSQFDVSDFLALEEEEKDPYPDPDPPPVQELCSRLCLDPKTDPKGKLGNLPVDIRTVLLPEEREKAAPILAMVGGLPPAEPLLRTLWRLCHRLAWLEQQKAASRQPSAASLLREEDGGGDGSGTEG